jgi:hypothetical protein
MHDGDEGDEEDGREYEDEDDEDEVIGQLYAGQDAMRAPMWLPVT